VSTRSEPVCAQWPEVAAVTGVEEEGREPRWAGWWIAMAGGLVADVGTDDDVFLPAGGDNEAAALELE
jgi:hypothetical protein